MAAKLLPRGNQSKEIRELKLKLREFQPCNIPLLRDHREIVIGLFGNTGAGKSSLINSLLSIFREKKYDIRRACTGDMMSNRGVTVVRMPFQLTDGIKLVDNRGMDRLGETKVLNEIEAQLEGRRGYGLPVMSGERNIDIIGDAVHVAIFVINGDRRYEFQFEGGSKFVDVFKRIHGRSPLAVITHADSASKKNLKSTKTFLKTIGIDQEEVFEVENTTGNKDLSSDQTLTMLKMLTRCTVNAELIVEYQECKQAGRNQELNRTIDFHP